MAILHIQYRITGEDKPNVIHPEHAISPLLERDIEEHPYELSNEIWGCIGKVLGNKRAVKDSVLVTIDTDDNKHIDVPKEVILKCFEPQCIIS